VSRNIIGKEGAGCCREMRLLWGIALRYEYAVIHGTYTCREPPCVSLCVPPHPEYPCHKECLGTALADFVRWQNEDNPCGKCRACRFLYDLVPYETMSFTHSKNMGFLLDFDLPALLDRVLEESWLFMESL